MYKLDQIYDPPHYIRINYIEDPVKIQGFYSDATELFAKESYEDQNKTKPGTNKTVTPNPYERIAYDSQ